MKSSTLLNRNLKKLSKSKVLLYVLVLIALLNIVALIKENNIKALVVFILVGLASTLVTKNMIHVLLIAILVTNFLIAMKVFGKKNTLEGLDGDEPVKSKNRRRKNLQNVEEFSLDSDDDDSDDEDDVRPAVNSNAQKTKAKERQNKLPSAIMSDADDASPIDADTSILNVLKTKNKSLNNMMKHMDSKKMNVMSNDAHKILDHQEKLLDKLEKMEPLVNRAGGMLERFQNSKIGKLLGK